MARVSSNRLEHPHSNSDGGTFKDEFHGRLRFTHRGLLGMASSGPDTNRSQFFITLDRCEWIDNKHTIFGKAARSVDGDARPTAPIRIPAPLAAPCVPAPAGAVASFFERAPVTSP